jgi:polysaccharide biosynthesis protein PslG
VLEEEGPPDDFGHYAAFMGALAARYAGRVDAYQIWHEPNLAREWNTGTYNIGGQPYVGLLTAAYRTIKAADADALVITAGLAPTGYNDGINAIDDRQFLHNMYENGVVEVSDAIAAHPGGWANPPDAECCNQPAGVDTHYENPVFFFKDTLTDYRAIMLAHGDDRPLWVTKFGWGTAEGGNQPSQEHVFINYTTLAEQAIFTPRAFELAQELGFVGPMFLYNLNGCNVSRPDNPLLACYYSLLALDGSLRPVFSAVQVLEK